MGVYEELKNRDNKYSNQLINLIDSSKEDIVNHLNEINLSMPNFDVHNDKHSEMVLCNIEKLLGSKVKKLTDCELFMIYMSAFLHDCGMGLPEYELKILKMTEGNEKFPLHSDLDSSIRNDGFPVFKMTEAEDFITTNIKSASSDKTKLEDFIFAFNSETHLIKDLAKRLTDYQAFRNGYTRELNQANDLIIYKEISDSIREQFIRETHGKRSKDFIINWGLKFSKESERPWLKGMSIDLGNVCLAHTVSGPTESELTNSLSQEILYFDGLRANTRFIAVLLRLGDVLHFSLDRARKSLQSQRDIRNAVSKSHWEVKQESVSYHISSTLKEEKKQISYTAFCSDPKNYYFLHDYLNSVDDELERYQGYLKSLRYGIETDKNEIKKIKEKYQLNLPLKVDRKNIKYDKNMFQPEIGLKFKMDQKNILNLLMGVGLYKNKYYALRELYQNSLDACRVAISEIENFTQAKIEFGLGRSSNGERTFIVWTMAVEWINLY